MMNTRFFAGPRPVLTVCIAASAFLAGVGEARAIDSSPYCGLYAAYGASIALGKPIVFRDLLQTKYLGSSYGSTSAELVNALGDHDLDACAFAGLGVESLRLNPCPMILHVAAGEQLEAYNHWILYLRSEGEYGVIADAVDGEHKLSLSQLLSRWDGNAILVDRKRLDIFTVVAGELMYLGRYAALAFVVPALAWVAFGRRQGARRLTPMQILSQSAVVVSAGVLSGLTMHAFDPSVGLLRNPGPVAFVAAANIEGLVPRVGLTELEGLIRSGSTAIVDARFEEDFNIGHLPGAVSLPIDASDRRRAEVVSRLPRDRPIVVYCQSEGCKFQDVVSNSLIREGFTKIMMYPGGWVEWKDSRAATAFQRHSPGGG